MLPYSSTGPLAGWWGGWGKVTPLYRLYGDVPLNTWYDFRPLCPKQGI